MSGDGAALTRRDFIWKTGQFAVLGAAGSMLASCDAQGDNLLAPSASEHMLVAATLGGPHQLSITGPQSLLRYGQSITITGTIKDSRGRALANTVIGVSDGLRLFSRTTKTDANGKIAYATKVKAKGVAVVEFVIDGYRYPFAFQSRNSQSPKYASSVLFSSIAIKNATTRTLTARVRDSKGKTYQYSIPKNTTKSVVTVKKSAPKRVTAFAGVTTSATVGQASLTVNTNGVATATIAAGQALIRGSVYATSAGDVGSCWAPGTQAGIGPVEISGEVAVCAGTDGVSIGAGGSLSGATAGFSVEVY